MAQDVPLQWAKIAAWKNEMTGKEAKFGWKVKSQPSYHAVLPVALPFGSISSSLGSLVLVPCPARWGTNPGCAQIQKCAENRSWVIHLSRYVCVSMGLVDLVAVKCLMAGFEECMSSDRVFPSLIPPGTFSADFSKVIWVSSLLCLPGHH